MTFALIPIMIFSLVPVLFLLFLIAVLLDDEED